MQPSPSSPSNVRRRGSSEFMTPKLLAALDKCKLSDRDAVHIIISTSEALGTDVSKLVINRSTLQRLRQKFRKEKAKELQDKFNLREMESLVVHWDGKLLSDLSGKEKVDRLPVIVSFEGITKLLGVPKLEAGTGEKQAKAIFETLHEWGIADKVQALCCDTTASNTGRLNGACVLIEQLMEHDLLYLPCRHHILEIVLRSVFAVKFSLPTSGPDVPIFKRFQETWPNINATDFNVGINDPSVKSAVQNSQNQAIEFCMKSLQYQQCREDYRELLELTVIFLGATPPRGIFFRYPGAIHHARWMSKAIYSLKIFLFRNQFQLQPREHKAFRDISIFLVNCYVKAWFGATAAIKAPFNDLQFLKQLAQYPDSDISRAAISKFCGHLWYLAPENVALAFFDSRVPKDTKLKMAKATKPSEESEDITVKRVLIHPRDVQDLTKKDLSDFVSAETLNFFSRFKIPSDFLEVDPDVWEARDDYFIRNESEF